MLTRFSPVLAPRPVLDDSVLGVHLDLGGMHITGMTPRFQGWGGRIWFTSLTGWWDAPGTTGQTTQFLLADGGWNDRAFRTPRVIEIEGYLDGPDRPTVRAGLDWLAAQIPLDTPSPLVVSEDGLQRYCMVRMADDPAAAWENGPDLLATFNIQLVAGDPRRLAGTGPDDGWRVYGPVGLPSSVGGLTFPFTTPLPITAVTTTGRVALSLEGTAQGNTVVEFVGPVLNPGVREVGTGKSLWFDLSLLEGQRLTVDLRTRSVLLNGVSRRGARRGQWVSAANDSVWEFTAGNYNQDARMIVRTQEAWI